MVFVTRNIISEHDAHVWEWLRHRLNMSFENITYPSSLRARVTTKQEHHG